MQQLVIAILISLIFSSSVQAVVRLPDPAEVQAEMDQLIDESVGVSAKAEKASEKLVKKGIKLHEKGKYEAAIKAFKKALLKDPLSVLAYYELAVSYYAADDLPRAYRNAIKTLVLHPGLEHAYIIKNSVLDDAGYPEQALKEWDKLLDINPKSFMGMLNKGVTLLKMKEYEQGEAVLINASQLDPQHPSPYYYLMLTCSVQGFNYDEERYGKQFLEVAENGPRRESVTARVKELNDLKVYVPNHAEPTKLFVLREIIRLAWRKAKHRENYPQARGYQPSLKEEQQIVDSMIEYAAENADKLTEKEHAYIAELKELVQQGHIEARNFILLKSELGQVDLAWGDTHQDEINAYLDWLMTHGQ